MTLFRRTALAGLLASTATGLARAADFPSRPMNWIVPFPPGGSNDIFARPVAAFVGQRLGEPVVVENRGGAGGTIGGMTAARAKPDGCTLLVVNPSLTFASIVYAESGFDLMRDFAPVSGMAQVPVALVVNPAKVAAKDLAGFLAMARKQPGVINIGSSGLGTIPHMAIVLLQQRTGIQLTHVPYRGGGPAITDYVAGRIDIYWDAIAPLKPWVEKGNIKPLAVTSALRSFDLPQVPTVIEAGMPDLNVFTWTALFAPAGTPGEITAKLETEMNKGLQDSQVQETFEKNGYELFRGSSAAVTDLIRNDLAKWQAVVKATGVKPD